MTEASLHLAQLIESASGFVIPERGRAALTALARERAAALGLAGVADYLELLRARPDSKEWRLLLGRITIKESFLFRGPSQFEALARTILPELAARRGGGGLRVWCAGCARGEEAATLAIVVAAHPACRDLEWSILATDVDEGALADAREGRYGPRAVAGVPPAVLARHFTERDGLFEFDPALRARITYRRLNLVEPRLDPPGAPFDLVFLRNVLIYFRPELQQRVVAAVERSLAPGGCLFLGPSESLLPLGSALAPRDLGGCFCYGRATGGAPPVQGPRPPAAPFPAVVAGPPCGSPPLSPAAGEPPSLPERAAGVARGIAAAADLDAARRAAALLRLEFPESPVAHLLEGLAWERAGASERALLAFRGARYLAPEMAVVRYLLGLTLEALGHREAAMREYRAVLSATAPPPAWLDLERLGVPGQEAIVDFCREKLKCK
ncbi:MAG: hypothetical protein MUE90_00600 [Thermoanaerobaculales bacterium]|nr:hypothetical protein [Thermoanaerobaculales bacterium]